MIQTDKYFIKFSSNVSYEDAEEFRKIWTKVGAEIEEMNLCLGSPSDIVTSPSLGKGKPISDLLAELEYARSKVIGLKVNEVKISCVNPKVSEQVLKDQHEEAWRELKNWEKIALAIEAQIQKRLEEEYLTDK